MVLVIVDVYSMEALGVGFEKVIGSLGVVLALRQPSAAYSGFVGYQAQLILAASKISLPLAEEREC